ncbi:MAG: DUF2911 domain-containing protein [Cyclobacteriaceae bacterium]|nr:DUF2911 domain-containing protein [Cyclobacteriaceae bacterium]
MKKFLLVLGVILVIICGALVYMRTVYTKSFSPEDKVSFSSGDLALAVQYNRPYKKGRVIFGDLVPYEQVWRTGANEATIFTTNKDLIFEGQTLPAGSYSLFTIPDEESWTFIFNKETGQWGVNYKGQVNRNPAKDILKIEAPSVQQEKEFEQFTISIERWGEELQLTLMWDKTLVSLPFTVK